MIGDIPKITYMIADILYYSFCEYDVDNWPPEITTKLILMSLINILQTHVARSTNTIIQAFATVHRVTFPRITLTFMTKACGGLSLTVREHNYSGPTWSLSWLLMSWLFASSGHQRPCRIRNYCLSWGRISTICVMVLWMIDIACWYILFFL